MTAWAWIVIAAVAIVAIPALIVTVGIVRNRSATKQLREHYGREYERLVSATGSEKGANRELATRERRHGKLDLVPLTPDAVTNFTNGWEEVQASFVDDPANAVAAADRLVTEVMRERGYPIDDFDRRAADISVDHPDIVENYRAAHGITTAEPDDVSTEQQREAFVHYRTLFETLIRQSADDAA
jgi:hypothetical protein